ncbi:hypothetical protein [Vibrio coralliirubri]|uniref:hypothetical protein n=1 Tax=Vibrio coralliirubri TaxID=1516159 RepID=UPI000B34C5AA|nr:hypothetical protein [Vibrio coralliirubri]
MKVINYLLSVLLLFSSPQVAWATVDVMELDGNATSDNSGIDWDDVNDPNSMVGIAEFFQKDRNGIDQIFWKGGSKDDSDITDWAFRTASPQPKDDFTNAYAAAFESEGDLLIYFGADRYANNGDMYIGFWFLQDQVGLPDGQTKGDFVGQHVNGDILVLISFPQASGGNPYIEVLQWDLNNGDVTDNMTRIFQTDGDPKSNDFVGARCGSGAVGVDKICAIANDDSIGAIPLPNVQGWDYLAKTGETTSIPTESFVEGRLNLSALLNDEFGIEDIPCFSSFLVESRASRSIDASLADFVVGSFSLCSISIAATCNTTSFTVDGMFNIDYTVTVTNTGPGSLGTNGDYEVAFLSESPILGALPVVGNGDEVWSVGESFSFMGNYLSVNNGAVGVIDGSVDLDGLIVNAQAPVAYNCPPIDLSPMVEISKVCNSFLEVDSGQVVLKKTYDVEICNTGDIPLAIESLVDSKDDSLSRSDLPTEVVNSSYYLDFALPCDDLEDVTTCGAGNMCSALSADPELFACKTGEGEWIPNFGDAIGQVCTQVSKTYAPNVLPTGTAGMLSNQVTATFDSLFLQQAFMETSNIATCDVCPFTVPEP